MSDFSDRPLVAGTVRGVRAFSVRDGILTGPAFGTAFEPGENVAWCLTRQEQMWPLWSFLNRDVQELLAPQAHHQSGCLRCSCGFYAYFDGGPNMYATSDRVVGIIEGYGLCTVGDRGFRAEKARLVALVDPYMGVRPPRSHIHDLYDLYADWDYGHNFPGAAITVIGGLVGLGIAGCGFIALPWTAPLFLIGLFVAVVCIATGPAGFHGISRHYPSTHPELTCSDRRPGRDLRAVAKNYPDVPRYRTLEDALACHPVEVPS